MSGFARMNRRGLLPLLLFVGLAAAQEGKSEVLQVGRIAKSIRLRLQLGEGGSVRVESDRTWRSMALVDVVRHIDLAKTSFNELERAEGRSGYDRGPEGIEASRLPVELDVHPDTPWQSVSSLGLKPTDAPSPLPPSPRAAQLSASRIERPPFQDVHGLV